MQIFRGQKSKKKKKKHSCALAYMQKKQYLCRLIRKNALYLLGHRSVGVRLGMRGAGCEASCVGDVVLRDIKASVIKNQSAPLLLGQSCFRRFGTVEVDNKAQVIRLIAK